MASQLNIFDELQKSQTRADELRLEAHLRHRTGLPSPIDEIKNRVAMQQQGRVLAERGRIVGRAARESAVAADNLPDAVIARGVGTPRSIGALQGPIQQAVAAEIPGFYIPDSRTPITGRPMVDMLRKRGDAAAAFANYDAEANVRARVMSNVTAQQSLPFMRQELLSDFTRQNAFQLNASKTAARFQAFGEEFDRLGGKINNILINRGMKDVMGRTGYHTAGGTGIVGTIQDKLRGASGVAFKALYPEKYDKLANSVLDADKGFLRNLIVGASIEGDSATLDAARKVFNSSMALGVGKTSRSMPTRLMLNANWSATKMGARAGMGAVRGANVASKAILGASLGQVGFAAAVVGGIGYGLGNALGITGSQAAQAASAVHETFKQMNKPVYGYSELGQSTQGLVFGLNSRRTR